MTQIQKQMENSFHGKRVIHEGFDLSDHCLLPPIDVRAVSRWLSIAMSLTVWGGIQCQQSDK